MSAAIADSFGWIKVAPGAMPADLFDIQVWDSEDAMSVPGFWADEDACFYSRIDGLPFASGRITHWMEVQAPEGVTL